MSGSNRSEPKRTEPSPSRREILRTGAGALAAFALSPELAALKPPGSRRACKLAIIGVGRQGRSILGELQKIDGAEVAAVADDNPSRLKSGLRRARGATGYASAAELLEKEAGVEAVIVATPTHLHREPALQALEAGKHVYCEAPLASTLEDGRAIAAAARRAGTRFQVGLQGRSNPVYRLARSFARAGTLGDLVNLRAQYNKKTSWRTASSDPAFEEALNWRLDPGKTIGLAGELGTHQFDVIHWFLGRHPVSVRGSGGVHFHRDGREVADSVHCDLGFADGVRMQYTATIANSYGGSYELLSGSNAAIKLAWSHGWMFKEADATTQGWEVYANRQQFHNDQGITLIADATQLAAQDRLKEGVGLPYSSLYYALSDFLRSVTEGEPVACGAAEGLAATAVGILAHRATVTGEEIEISEELLGEG